MEHLFFIIDNFYFFDAFRVGIGNLHVEVLEVELETYLRDTSLDFENQSG